MGQLNRRQHAYKYRLQKYNNKDYLSGSKDFRTGFPIIVVILCS